MKLLHGNLNALWIVCAAPDGTQKRTQLLVADIRRAAEPLLNECRGEAARSWGGSCSGQSFRRGNGVSTQGKIGNRTWESD